MGQIQTCAGDNCFTQSCPGNVFTNEFTDLCSDPKAERCRQSEYNRYKSQGSPPTTKKKLEDVPREHRRDMDDRPAIATKHHDADSDDTEDDYHNNGPSSSTDRDYSLMEDVIKNHADASEESTKPSTGRGHHVGSEIFIENDPEPVGIDGDYDMLPIPFSFENILTNLEACEEKYFNDLFCLFDDEGTGKVNAQHMLLREALIYNSTLKVDVIDSTLSQVTDYRGEISAEDFISLVRTHAADDSLTMVAFYTAGDGDDLVPGECEIALIKHANAEFNVSFDEIKWEMVMSSIIDPNLLCDDALFRRHCNRVARIVRLYNLQNLVTPT